MIRRSIILHYLRSEWTFVYGIRYEDDRLRLDESIRIFHNPTQLKNKGKLQTRKRSWQQIHTRNTEGSSYLVRDGVERTLVEVYLPLLTVPELLRRSQTHEASAWLEHISASFAMHSQKCKLQAFFQNGLTIGRSDFLFIRGRNSVGFWWRIGAAPEAVNSRLFPSGNLLLHWTQGRDDLHT